MEGYFYTRKIRWRNVSGRSVQCVFRMETHSRSCSKISGVSLPQNWTRLLPCGRVGPLCARLKIRAETLLGIWTATSKELWSDVIAQKKCGAPVSCTKYILYMDMVHPQKVRFQNVRFQNVRFQNVWNVRFTKRQVYKMSGLKNVRSYT